MRRLTFLALLLLAGCQEPTFEERYAEAEKSIRATAAAIDKELAEQERAQQAAEAVAAPSGTAR